MFAQLLIGSLIVSISIIIHTAFVVFAIRVLRRLEPQLIMPPLFIKMLVVLIATTLWMLLALTLSVWLWAEVLFHIGVFDALEPAVYFSLVAFTTLGFGDIILEPDWRILSGLIATNGWILFGLSTAFLFEVIARLHREQPQMKRK